MAVFQKICSGLYTYIKTKENASVSVSLFFYLQIAIPGIHNMDAKINIIISTTAHAGHSCLSVSPVEATQAWYPDPPTAISTKLAISMDSIASGDKYFQHTSQ